MTKLKKSEMKIHVTYILCPDKTCQLFFDDTRRIPCENECPKQDTMKKIIICQNCQAMIELPGDYHMARRVDHKCPGSIGYAWNFRMSGKYYLLHKKPE